MTGDATVIGIHDYWLGGHSHLRADREAGRRIAARWPSVPVLMRAAQDFHLRAAAWCAQRGVDRFVRLATATWLPGRNVHDAVRRVNPRARVAYMARQTDALVLSEGLLDGRDGTAAFRGSADDPAGVLAAAPVAEMLAAGEPVCVILPLVLHFLPPAGAAKIMAEYTAALPGGSYVVVSAMVTADRAAAREFREAFTPDPVYRIHPWSPRDVRRALSGLDRVPPGVVPVHRWPARTRWAGPQLEGQIPVRVVGGVARKR